MSMRSARGLVVPDPRQISSQARTFIPLLLVSDGPQQIVVFGLASNHVTGAFNCVSLGFRDCFAMSCH